jgi:PII-like signaling protein
MDITGKGKLLKVYVGETEKWKGKSLYHQLLLKLKEHGIAGVTVYRGIEGYGADKVLHSAKILDLSADLPMVIEAVDTEENITKVLPLVKEMVPRGLVMVVDIEIIKYGPSDCK